MRSVKIPEGDVYIIFGDTARSDGDNIHGVFASLESAEEELELLRKRRPWEDFHIEEHGLWGVRRRG